MRTNYSELINLNTVFNDAWSISENSPLSDYIKQQKDEMVQKKVRFNIIESIIQQLYSNLYSLADKRIEMIDDNTGEVINAYTFETPYDENDENSWKNDQIVFKREQAMLIIEDIKRYLNMMSELTK